MAADFLESLFFDHPWYDPDLPSLVAEDDDGRLQGFIGTHARRMRHRERDLWAAWCSHLVVNPDQAPTGLGMRLLTSFMSGPQELSLSDTASDVVLRMWRAAGGRVDPLRSLAWMRVLRRGRWAARLAAARLARRSRSGLVPVHPLALTFPGRPAPAAGLDLAMLTPDALAAQCRAVAGSVALCPCYDETFAQWLLQKAEQHLGPTRVVRRLVLRRGRAVGWFVYTSDPRGRARVLEVGARQRDVDAVTDALFATAAEDGALVLTGRVEPHLHDTLRRHHCVIGAGQTAVIHARDPWLLADLASPQSLWARLTGEWW
jgi:hypothetical protein